jgi:hypothetical protein
MSRPSNLKSVGASTYQAAEGRVSTVRWNPKGMRRSTGPQSRERSHDEPVGQRWGKVEPALWRRRRYSFTHRTKVFAGGTVRKIWA